MPHRILTLAIVLTTIATLANFSMSGTFSTSGMFSVFDAIGMSIESPVMAQTQSDASARNRGIVEASFKAWSDGTGSPFDLLADDATWTIVGRSAAAGIYRGREAFLRDVIRPFNARMREPLKPVIRRIVSDGPMVVIFFDAKGVARDGVPYVNTYAWFMELRDGRVIAASAFFDSIAFDELWTRVKP